MLKKVNSLISSSLWSIRSFYSPRADLDLPNLIALTAWQTCMIFVTKNLIRGRRMLSRVTLLLNDNSLNKFLSVFDLTDKLVVTV